MLGALLVVLVPSPATAATSDTRPPSTPTGLLVQHVGFTEVTLGWNPSTDDSGSLQYEVDVRGPAYGQRFAALESTKAFTALPQGTTLTASVTAVDGAGNRSAAASIQFTTQADTTTPPAPRSLRAVMNGGILTTLAWDPATDNSSTYHIVADGITIFGTTGTSARVSTC
jgi:hypothetical protein